MTTNVILEVREKPGTEAALLEGVHIIGAVRESESAFHGGSHYVDNDDPERIAEVQKWDSVETQQAFMAEIRGDFADVSPCWPAPECDVFR